MTDLRTTVPEVSVLVVDDVEQNLLATTALLARPGVRVITATSGEEALERLLEGDMAVALLDVQMPGMDGFELAELMRGADRSRHVPIIFLTAAGEERQRVFRGYEAGAVDFLHKPLDSHVLVSKVGVFVELAQQRCLLDRRMTELQRSLQLNETMSAVLAHDLRSPLSAILTSAEIVLQQAGDEMLQSAGRRIRSSGGRMARMIDQLLDFTRLRSGVLAMDRQPISLSALCEQALTEMRAAWPHADVRMTCAATPDVFVDPDRIAQVLANLLGNAVQHGQSGHPITLHLDRDDTHARIAVKNRGELAAQAREGLFAPFHPGARNSEGLGLGLYIVEQFVRANGGAVHAHSEHGTTTFEMTLPLVDEATR
jgi:two-component system, sensor histidine kinase and response regulator